MAPDPCGRRPGQRRHRAGPAPIGPPAIARAPAPGLRSSGPARRAASAPAEPPPTVQQGVPRQGAEASTRQPTIRTWAAGTRSWLRAWQRCPCRRSEGAGGRDSSAMGRGT
eukprot:14080589-Alexandrium_andersonii.AAC.1